MGNTPTSYTDDNATRAALVKAGSERMLHEIYGLFYGGMAAPNAADPTQYVSVIFDDDTASQTSEEDAGNVRDNLLSLWNFIARWKPEEEPFYFPEQEYPDNYQGLLQHLKDDVSMIQYFIAGLNLGGTEETDFSEDAVDAMHELAETTARLQKNIEVCGTFDPKAVDDDPESTTKMLDELEDILADCIARVTTGLKDAKG